VDIGANYGVYTLTMARHAGAGGKVWAFEPASTTASYLEKSIRANAMNNIRLTRAALSNRRGTARLALNENSELNTLVQASDSGRGETVPLMTLDECAREYEWRDTEFIKLDAEGEEGNIIEGGKQFLSEQSPLIMFELKHADTVNLPLIRQFHALGYASYRLIRGLNLLAPFNPQEPLDGYQLNLFCCKPERASRLEARGLLAPPAESPAPSIVVSDEDTWKKRLLRLACVRESTWLRTCVASSHFTEPGGEKYRHALNLHAMAHLESASPAARYAALTQSLMELGVAAQTRPTGARLQSLARVAWETGHRTMAIQVLNRLADFLSEATPAIDEPFLAVSDRFDEIEPGGNMLAWCRAAVREQLARLQAYSSYFFGTGALKLLEALKSGEFRSAEMERRYQLVRMRHGMQDGPECSRLLKTATDENRNPGYWCE
jgi:FkbM family methyltransferase